MHGSKIQFFAIPFKERLNQGERTKPWEAISVDVIAFINGVTAPYPMGYGAWILRVSYEKSPASPPGTLAVSAPLATLPTDRSCYATDH
jgi:hypothetical protein